MVGEWVTWCTPLGYCGEGNENLSAILIENFNVVKEKILGKNSAGMGVDRVLAGSWASLGQVLIWVV
jgi:hypothetical protein